LSDARWAVGDVTGLPIPADAAALRDGGPRYLTEAFARFGALAPDNSVTGLTEFAEVSGGSTGRKLLLTVEYEHPGPRRELFVKFSRDLDDPARDHGRTQMESEIRFASLSRDAAFPIIVPDAMFADYHAESGTGVLITERIPFGANGIEPQHAKCMDYVMHDPIEHYRTLLTAVATLAGTEQAGRLRSNSTSAFGTDIEALSVGERIPATAERLVRRVDRLAEFAANHPGLLPANVRAAAFLARLRFELPRLLEVEPYVWRYLRERTEYVALCHWNANVDNAWFWRDADGVLNCGLMDWGCVGRMNVAMALWGALCSAETALWNHEFDALLALYADVFRANGGAELDVVALRAQVVLYAGVMTMTWLMDVPSYVTAAVSDLDATTTRMAPGIRNAESVRCRLQMLTNALNLWESSDVNGLLSAISAC
jgi:hypothetical protein